MYTRTSRLWTKKLMLGSFSHFGIMIENVLDCRRVAERYSGLNYMFPVAVFVALTHVGVSCAPSNLRSLLDCISV